MARYVVVRVVSGVALFFAITLFVFVAFYAIPQDRREQETTDAYRIHGSVPGEYAHYVWRIVRHGDLGYSYANREPVTKRLFRAAPITLSLVLGGVVVWLLIALPLGVLAALRPRSLLDRATTVFVLIGVSAHPVWLGLMLSYVFGHTLHVFPADGYCSVANLASGCDGLFQWTYHLILPWFTFGVLNAAMFTAMARGLVLEELSEEYVRTARAKGAGPMRIVRAHLLKNVTLPLVTIIGLNAGTALAGVIFVESAFSLPGLGGILRQSTLRRDLPMTAGSVIFFALAILLLNLLVDLAYTLLDPRVRFGSRASVRA
ncbi:MAG: ABC transporter permease [Gaiellaceae bacterium]